MSTKCHYCNKDIAFSDQYMSKNDRHILMNIDLAGVITGPHQCKARRQEYLIWKQKNRKYCPCRKCGDDIYFDDFQKTESGKWIPIAATTAAPYLCIQK
jgi:hypothetical protein